jgi:outer membrane protein OmpA-like peptidoglycan-associated protein
MRKLGSGVGLAALLAVAGLTLSACATEGYVDEHIAAVNQHIEATNAKVDQVNGKVDALSGRVDGVERTANQGLQRANDAYTLAQGKFTNTQIGDTVSVYFDTGKSALRQDAQATLTDLAMKLVSDNKNVVLEIVGHGDVRGGKGYNRDLGRQRAAEVGRFLYGAGVPLNRMMVASWGEERPTAKGASPDELQKDRRVDIMVKG